MLTDRAFLPAKTLRAMENAETARYRRVEEKTQEILSDPDRLGSLIQDHCLNPALTHQLAALCRAKIEMLTNYRANGNGERDEQSEKPFDTDVLYHNTRLFKVLLELAQQEAGREVPEADAEAVFVFLTPQAD